MEEKPVFTRENMDPILNRRNTQGAFENIQFQNKEIAEMHRRIEALAQALQTMSGEFVNLRNLVVEHKVKITGHGPTE